MCGPPAQSCLYQSNEPEENGNQEIPPVSPSTQGNSNRKVIGQAIKMCEWEKFLIGLCRASLLTQDTGCCLGVGRRQLGCSFAQVIISVYPKCFKGQLVLSTCNYHTGVEQNFLIIVIFLIIQLLYLMCDMLNFTLRTMISRNLASRAKHSIWQLFSNTRKQSVPFIR